MALHAVCVSLDKGRGGKTAIFRWQTQNGGELHAPTTFTTYVPNGYKARLATKPYKCEGEENFPTPLPGTELRLSIHWLED